MNATTTAAHKLPTTRENIHADIATALLAHNVTDAAAVDTLTRYALDLMSKTYRTGYKNGHDAA